MVQFGAVFLGTFGPFPLAYTLVSVRRQSKWDRCHQLIHDPCRLSLQAGHEMTVNIQCYAWLGVPKHVRNYNHRNSVIEQERSCSVPQIMESELWEAGFFEDSLEIHPQIAGIYRCAHRVGKDQVMLLPAGTSEQLLLLLEHFVLSQYL